MTPLGMKPLISLRPGMKITPRILIGEIKMSNWRYANDFMPVRGSLAPGLELTIVGVDATAFGQWVEVSIAGSDPPKILKIAGDELNHNFILR